MGICSDCAQAGNDCCHMRGDPAFRFGLTQADLERIERATGRPRAEWSEEDAVPQHVLTTYAHAIGDETTAGMFPGGRRTALKFDGPFRACNLLGRDGCTLDLDTRPRFCALYPHWHRNGKILINALTSSQRCPAAEGSVSLASRSKLKRLAVLSHNEMLGR